MSERNANFSLVCRVSTRLCALPLHHVRETLRPLPVAPLAGAPDHVLGLALIRGEAQPVVDLARLLGLQAYAPQRFVTLNVGGRRVALAVGEVLGLRELLPRIQQALPPLLRDAGKDAVAALAALDAELLLILDGARLLPDAAMMPEQA